MPVSITWERAGLSWDCWEDKKTMPRKYCYGPGRYRLHQKCQQDGKHLTKGFVCPRWELCPAHIRKRAVNALASGSPWPPEQGAGLGWAGDLSGEELERAGPSQASFLGAKDSAWCWGFPQWPEGQSPPPELRNAQNGCFLTAYKPV